MRLAKDKYLIKTGNTTSEAIYNIMGKATMVADFQAINIADFQAINIADFQAINIADFQAMFIAKSTFVAYSAKVADATNPDPFLGKHATVYHIHWKRGLNNC
jgi:hypothetical protein